MGTHLKQQTSDCLKIVLYGPESTGKTTLCNQLALYYKTIVVPEFMRAYLQDKWDRTKTACEKQDLLPIAKGQVNSENELAPLAKKVLFCDTNLRELKVYSKIYYNGFCPSEILDAVEVHHYNIYFLTYIDTPWQPDDLRDKPLEREAMFQRFEHELKASKCNYVILKGTEEERLQTAITHVDLLLKINHK